jgi:hypothetical protein
MSMMQPIGGPRAEVSAALPFVAFPPGPAGEAAAADLTMIAARAETGDRVAASVIAMLGEAPESAASRFAGLVGEAGAGTDAASLYERARQLDAAGRTGDAALLLAILSGLGHPQAAGLLGLAVLATRQERMDLAESLVSACLEATERHPRACSLAGIGELERGNRQAAQAYLATASRLARRNPDYRAELQIAQRALLLMHLG